MLFIHGSLSMGGIETFYVRMAKERHKMGQTTRILLLTPRSRSNAELLAEAYKYADIYFLSEISMLPVWVTEKIPYHLSLLVPLDKKKVLEVVEESSHIHVSGGFGAYMALRLLKLTRLKIPITIGLYHSLEFSWGEGKLPFYECKNRELFFKIIPKKNIVFFNEAMIDFYGEDFSNVNLFPIGVIDQKDGIKKIIINNDEKLVLGSVGRLVEFKSYNLWMLDVVSSLKDAGVDVSYLVYGDGPLKGEMQRKIDGLGISEQVILKGTLDYSDFPGAVSVFDVFVGSGTAIVEAASLGVPSIIGVENENAPLTYGFLSDIPGFSYNEGGLYKLHPVLNVLENFLKLNVEEKNFLCHEHIKKAEVFSISICNENFNSINPLKMHGINKCSLGFRLMYSFSFFFYSFSLKIKGSSLNNRVVRS